MYRFPRKQNKNRTHVSLSPAYILRGEYIVWIGLFCVPFDDIGHICLVSSTSTSSISLPSQCSFRRKTLSSCPRAASRFRQAFFSNQLCFSRANFLLCMVSQILLVSPVNSHQTRFLTTQPWQTHFFLNHA